MEVGAANSRSHGMQRASAEANSSDLRPGSQDFRALDATVVEVSGVVVRRGVGNTSQGSSVAALCGSENPPHTPFQACLFHMLNKLHQAGSPLRPPECLSNLSRWPALCCCSPTISCVCVRCVSSFTVLQVRKDHLLLALEKFDSDRMQQEVRLAAAAPMVTWRLDQSVRDTTARCVCGVCGCMWAWACMAA